MNIIIDFESEEPIYLQLKNEIIKGIARGELTNGYSLPSVRALAEDIGINMHTVNKAYNILKSEGYIVLDRRHGASISVSKKTKDDILSFKGEMEVIISKCIAKGISKEEVKLIIQDVYRELEG